MIEYSNTYSGRILVSEEKVIKTFKKSVIDEGLMSREIFWLRHLSDFDRTPNIIDAGEDFIVMTYVGERITKESTPSNWEDQIQYIYNSLKKLNCSHNDIKPEELLIKENKIYIVDFGWSTKTGEPIPANWPTEIGDEFKFGIHNFNDLYSLKKSINYILNK